MLGWCGCGGGGTVVGTAMSTAGGRESPPEDTVCRLLVSELGETGGSLVAVADSNDAPFT